MHLHHRHHHCHMYMCSCCDCNAVESILLYFCCPDQSVIGQQTQVCMSGCSLTWTLVSVTGGHTQTSSCVCVAEVLNCIGNRKCRLNVQKSQCGNVTRDESDSLGNGYNIVIPVTVIIPRVLYSPQPSVLHMLTFMKHIKLLCKISQPLG